MTTTPTDRTPPTASSLRPSSLYSGPRPTNPKPHSDWTTKRVPLTGTAGRRRRLLSTLLGHAPEALGVARAGIGVAYVIAPTRAHRPVAGPDAALPSTRAAGRTFGAREIYVGLSVLAAKRVAPQALGAVVAVGAALDVWDTAAFLLTRRYLRRDRVTAPLVAAVFAGVGIAAAVHARR